MNGQNRVSFVAVLTAVILLGACSSTPVAPPVIAKTPAPVVSVTPSVPSQVAAKPATPAAPVVTPLAPYLDPQNRLHKERSVYFDFDQAAIKPEATPLIELHGKYLATHPAVSIKIEGNTDEQGGAEYNLALGQKRAEAVLRTLKIYGVKDSQMEAVSFGEEKPQALGHDETAYAQNRRADLDYPAK